MFCGVCERSILIHRFANHLLEALRSGSPLSVPCDAMRSASEQVRAPSLQKLFHLSNESLIRQFPSMRALMEIDPGCQLDHAPLGANRRMSHKTRYPVYPQPVARCRRCWISAAPSIATSRGPGNATLSQLWAVDAKKRAVFAASNLKPSIRHISATIGNPQ